MLPTEDFTAMLASVDFGALSDTNARDGPATWAPDRPPAIVIHERLAAACEA